MLIDSIIETLGTQKNNITDALLQTKILLHNIGKAELADWVNNELNGYSDNSALPSYRVLKSHVKANAASIACQFSSHLVPISHLTLEQRENLETSEMRQSLHILEDLTSKEESSLRRLLPLEYNGLLRKQLTDGVHIQQAWCEISKHDVKNIIVQVRSRLLDFLLDLKSNIGSGITEANFKEKAARVDTEKLFNHAIYGSNNNTTIILGSHNTQNVQNGVTEGSFETLAKALTKVGVPSDEIENLQKAIKEDEKETGKASFIGRTGKWANEFMSKIAQGVIATESKEISGHVVNAITSYISAGL